MLWGERIKMYNVSVYLCTVDMRCPTNRKAHRFPTPLNRASLIVSGRSNLLLLLKEKKRKKKKQKQGRISLSPSPFLSLLQVHG